MSQECKKISIIIPVYNEEQSLQKLHSLFCEVLNGLRYEYELIFVNDGSSDRSQALLEEFRRADRHVRVIEFSRNFGKEIALTAGLQFCTGDAAVMIDSDLQHPIELLSQFIQKWQDGAEVVIGVRISNTGEGMVKRLGSKLYYRIMRWISEVEIVPQSTDYRLLDRSVIDAFKHFSEHNRMTRALIDWLGFRREYIYFHAAERFDGSTVRYTFSKLFRLATDSIISLSFFPLRLAGYLGSAIVVLSSLLGAFIVFEQYFLHDPLHLGVSGTGMLALLIIFLVGIVLACLGLIALYIATIQHEVLSRPLYVVRKAKKE